MDVLLAFCKWLEQTPVGACVRQSMWLFPAIESLHLLSMAALLGTIGAFDLRLIGVILRDTSITDAARRLLPCAWTAFLVQLLTGGLLFSSEATHMVRNPAFRIKMLLIMLAAAQAFAFHLTARRNPPAACPQAPHIRDRITGCASIALWIAIVAAGRWIGFI